MTNPYRDRPAYTFWKSGVTEAVPSGVDPVVRALFPIERTDPIATVGSCFAQHISKTLVQQGFNYLVTETFGADPGVVDEGFGVFPARFANVYTARQLVQLFDRAYGKFRPQVEWWQGKVGKIDPFRPRIQAPGFATVDDLLADRERHFAAVRRMFESCKIFIFTLGLTEAWISDADGAVYPLAPGVVATDETSACRFHNFGFAEVVADMLGFLDRLSSVNAAARVMLTVSPVPLIATFEDRHVLVSTVASKSVLRAAVEEITRRRPEVAYFPSYEIITGPQTRGRYYEPDLREVSPEGVAYVMSLFTRRYLQNSPQSESVKTPDAADMDLTPEDMARMAEISAIICDEEAIVQ